MKTRVLEGKHGFGAITECGVGERLQHRHVPKTVKGQRRIGPSNIHKQIAGHNLGYRATERKAGGQFSQPLLEDRSVHRVQQATRVELSHARSRSGLGLY